MKDISETIAKLRRSIDSEAGMVRKEDLDFLLSCVEFQVYLAKREFRSGYAWGAAAGFLTTAVFYVGYILCGVWK